MQNNVICKEIKAKCILCGNCSAVCPKNAISYDNVNEKVIVDKNLCINCGLCVKNCPALATHSKEKTILGNVEKVYVGFSNNEEIRFKSASGGLLTQTLKYLIENNLVDKVLITDFNFDNMQADSYFTNDIKKIINACGSKYQIVNVNKSLKTVLKENSTFAYVGLPCHHKALEHFLNVNSQIKNRVKYKFSICCSHNCSIKILDYVIQYLKIRKEDIKSIKYRGDGWPKYLTITTRNNEQLKFPKEIWNNLFLSFFYTPKQCFNCSDFCGENSDISFADAWLQEYTSTKNNGYNLVFSHNENGENLLRQMIIQNQITLKEHSYKDIVTSQAIGLFYKKYFYQSNRFLDILAIFILKLNSKISKKYIMKFVNSIFLKYYFLIIHVVFISRRLKKFKERLLNENSDNKSTYVQ